MVRHKPEVLLIGPGVLKELSQTVVNMGGRPLMVSGPTSSKAIAQAFAQPDFIITTSSSQQVNALVSMCQKNTLLVAIGGGKVIDVVKMAAHLKGLAMISVPTVLSGDGIASPIAVIDGTSHKVSVPRALICDTDVIARAPLKWNAAGAGDLLSNISSTYDWERFGGPDYNPEARHLARQGALQLLEDLESGEDFTESLAKGLALSGQAMALAGSSKPASGSEHEISHAIDRLFPNRALHGYQVALASVFTTYLQSNPLRKRLIRGLEKLALPRRPQDINLTLEQFASCVELAPSTRPDRTTILEHLGLDRGRIPGLVREAFGL